MIKSNVFFPLHVKIIDRLLTKITEMLSMFRLLNKEQRATDHSPKIKCETTYLRLGVNLMFH